MKRYYDNLIFIKDKHKKSIILDYNTVEKNLRLLMAEHHRKFKAKLLELEDPKELDKREKGKILKE